jgi:hypothetical protein
MTFSQTDVVLIAFVWLGLALLCGFIKFELTIQSTVGIHARFFMNKHSNTYGSKGSKQRPMLDYQSKRLDRWHRRVSILILVFSGLFVITLLAAGLMKEF